MPEVSTDLVCRARDGDDRALAALVEASYPLVRRWALVQTRDAAEADDLTQDVLIRMIRNLSTFHGDARFGTWLYSVTRNAATDRHRRRARRARLAENPNAYAEMMPGAPADPAVSLEREELGSLLRAFFEELPERQREVFDLVELQGLAAGDVAELLGIATVSVRASLFKARKHMRARILEERPEVAEGLR
jgi:RNA polymerase sigma-70 factor (ECF subfamily)